MQELRFSANTVLVWVATSFWNAPWPSPSKILSVCPASACLYHKIFCDRSWNLRNLCDSHFRSLKRFQIWILQIEPPQLLFPLALKFYTWSRVNLASSCAHEIEPAAPKPTQPVRPPKTKKTWKMRNFWLPNRKARNSSQKGVVHDFLLISSCKKIWLPILVARKRRLQNRSCKTAHFSKICQGLNEFLPTSNGTCSYLHDTCFFWNYSAFVSSFQLAGTCACTVEAPSCSS